MNRRNCKFAILLFLAAFAAMGCRRNIVRAAPPSVVTPPPPEPMPQPTVPATAAETTPEPPPAVAPEPAAAPVVRTPQPRPRPPVEAEAPRPKTDPSPSPAAPQIAPALSARQLADAQHHTTNDIVAAEHNLQLANGKRLNATQNDLVEKIRDFLSQAHEAIRASDWVRAENLAHKAQILSGELVKSL